MTTWSISKKFLTGYFYWLCFLGWGSVAFSVAYATKKIIFRRIPECMCLREAMSPSRGCCSAVRAANLPAAIRQFLFPVAAHVGGPGFRAQTAVMMGH